MESGFENGQSEKHLLESKQCTPEKGKLSGKVQAFDAENPEQEDRREGEGEKKATENHEESMRGPSSKEFAFLEQLNSQVSLVHEWGHHGVELAKSGGSVDQKCRKQWWTPLELGAHFVKCGKGLNHEGRCQPCEVCTASDARDDILPFSQDLPECWHVS